MRAATKLSLVLAIGFILVASWACGPTGAIVRLDYKKFEPSVADNQLYKGKKVALLMFANRDKDTQKYYYFRTGSNEQFAYETDEWLESYVWYCYLKAFRKAGMVVLENVQQPSVPDFQLTINRLSENYFEYTVNYRYGRYLFMKTYSVQVDPLTAPIGEANKLEKAAYAMMNKSINAVLNDPEFQKAFIEFEKFNKSPEAKSVTK